MIPTIENPGPYDALSKARPGEPFFQLLGRDIAAPGAVTEWSRIRRNHAIRHLPAGSEELTDELRQCADAEGIALAMDGYRTGQADEDAPVATRIAHSGLMGESHEARERSRRIAETVEHLREAAYHMSEASGLLDTLFSPEAHAFDLAYCIGCVKAIDEEVAPKRSIPPIGD
jgi:hypothetical protein